MDYYTEGDTIGLKCTFRDDDGTLVDPTGISIQMYDEHRNPVGSALSVGEGQKVSTGVYVYPYTIPAGTAGSRLQHEWTATYSSQTWKRRHEFGVEWVV